MNKIELNNKLRRFFTRFGGGGIKALRVKDNTGAGNNGGSEDAQKLFEMFFGQMPYVCPLGGPPIEPMPITELSIAELLELCNEYSAISLIYKKQEPTAMAYALEMRSENTIGIRVLSTANRDMGLIPDDLPNGPWYYPTEKADIDLTAFQLPTRENPTFLTGVEIPQKEELTVKQMVDGVVRYNWNSELNRYEHTKASDTYTIMYLINNWVWGFETRMS